MRVYLKTLLTVLVILGFSYVLTLGEWRVVDNSVLETFFSAFGTIYAIVVGFVVYLVLNYYNALNQYITAEVNAIQDLRDFLVFIDGHDKEVVEVVEKIDLYVASVIKYEWPNMVSRDETNMDSSEKLYDVMKSVNKINPDNQSDIVALEKLIQTVSEITTYRTNRLKESRENLPPLLKQLVIILSVFIVVPFTFVPLEDPLVRILLTTAITFAVSLIYFVVLDLDSVYTGTWAVTNQPYRDLIEENQMYLQKYRQVAASTEEGEAGEMVTTGTQDLGLDEVPVDYSKPFLTQFVLALLVIGIAGGGGWFANFQMAGESADQTRKNLTTVLKESGDISTKPGEDQVKTWRDMLESNVHLDGGLANSYLPLPPELEAKCRETRLSSQVLLAALSLVQGEVQQSRLEIKIFEVDHYRLQLSSGQKDILPKSVTELASTVRDSLDKIKGNSKSLEAVQKKVSDQLTKVKLSGDEN